MPLRHLVVTPLPNGRTQQTARLSVHLSPRLRVKGRLDDYADVGDWGAFTLAAPALAFQVLVDGAPLPPAAVTVVSPAVDPAVWRAVFGAPATGVRVEPYAFLDRRGTPLAHVDSARLSAGALALARTVAALGSGTATRSQVERASADVRALLPSARDVYGKVGNGEDPPAPSTEFHDQLGPLGAHPHLLRVLGLAFDLEVTLPLGVVPSEVAVRTNWATKSGAAPRDEIPMRVRVDADFVAVVEQREYRRQAWLALSAPVYTVTQLDQVNAVAQLGHLDTELAAAGPDDPVEVPALLESGLSVVHTDLAPVLVAAFERQRAVEDGIDDFIRGRIGRAPLLWAEDVTAGVRYDVEDVARPGYRSLFDRQAPHGYRFPRDKALVVQPPQDEGRSSVAMFTDGSFRPGPLPTDVVYDDQDRTVAKAEQRDLTSWRVDDHVVTWSGWSLATPALGRSTTGDGRVTDRSANRPDAANPTEIVVDYAHVNGTLPALRYGHTYRFRGRAVDLAGNGPALADAAPPEAPSPPVRFGRLAPLAPPLVVRRASRPDPGVGDLAQVLVIRSELDDANVDVVPADRLLFPPRISPARLERHDLPRGGHDPAAYAFLAERDARTIADQTLEDAETGELVAGTAVVNGQVTAGPVRPAVRYLADAATNRAAFHGLPNSPAGAPLFVPYGSWPAYEAPQVVLASGLRAPRLSLADRRVTVYLPKGTVATAEVSSAPDPALVGHLLLAQDPAAAPGAADGTNRAISPRRTLTFVHAVRVPLTNPTFAAVTSTRNAPGQTSVVVTGDAGLHRATTERLVLRGDWTDTVDDTATPGLVELRTHRVVDRFAVPTAGPAAQAPIEPFAIDFGDTKRRHVTLTAEALCRFSRYFTERREFDVTAMGPLTVDARGVTASSFVLTDATTGTAFERDRHYRVDRAAGTLTILDTGVIPLGTRVRAEYVPLPVSRPLADEAPATFAFDVPSSARPPVPHVVAALPAFARSTTTSADGTRIEVVHDGRVVRLHLARPWFASGRDERLGVVVDPSGTAAPSRSRWGRDPIVASGAPADPLSTTAFPNATATAAGVDGRFDVAAHDVVYDATRGLWMADVLVDATFAYRPFVALEVCRYQDLALDGMHASATVEVAPMRLGARRVVTATSVAPGTVDVTLAGPDDTNVVTVTVQEADPAIADGDLRWRDVGTARPLARSGTSADAVHTLRLALGTTAAERRLVIDDAERAPAVGAAGEVAHVAYREVVAVPATW